MEPPPQINFAERSGRTLGRLWRGWARLDRRVAHWLVSKGCSLAVAKRMTLLIKLAILGVLLYAAFWLAVLISIMALVAWTARSSGPDESQEWALGNPTDHKQSVFYDPINYDDDPDPRFDEKR